MLYVWKKKSGIFLDGGNFNYEHNVRLIQLMQQFKRKNNCRLYWKFHPTTNPADYEPHIRYEQDVCSKDILLEESALDCRDPPHKMQELYRILPL